jgi:hypothetical protein
MLTTVEGCQFGLGQDQGRGRDLGDGVSVSYRTVPLGRIERAKHRVEASFVEVSNRSREGDERLAGECMPRFKLGEPQVSAQQGRQGQVSLRLLY